MNSLKDDLGAEEERRRSIMITKNAQLKDFEQLAAQYSFTAHRLNAKKRELAEMLKIETDVDKIKDLEQRRATVEQERYEVLDDLRKILDYIRVREKCRENAR